MPFIVNEANVFLNTKALYLKDYIAIEAENIGMKIWTSAAGERRVVTKESIHLMYYVIHHSGGGDVGGWSSCFIQYNCIRVWC